MSQFLAFSLISVDSTQITKHLKDLIESVESDKALMSLVEGLPKYKRACSLGPGVGE
jgi:hypothetical protein